MIQEIQAFRRGGHVVEAETACRDALQHNPHNVELLHLFGMLCTEAGRFTEALGLFQQVVAAQPDNAQFHQNLGTVLSRTGHHAEAADAFARAVALQPAFVEAHGNLAAEMQRLGHFAEAEHSARRVVELRPELASGHAQLGSALAGMGRTEDAIAAFSACISLDDRFRPAWNGLLPALERAGQFEQALEAYTTAVALFPDDSVFQSGRLYLLHHDAKRKPIEVFNEHIAWAKKFADPHTANAQPPDNDRSPDRRLRIGYVSADFREHPTARFIEPIITAHNRDRFEIFCYSDVARPDEVTVRFRKLAGVWREARRISDDQLAAMIRSDRIDILIETCGHMAGNRLQLYARKPTPIQLALPIYPGTTGVAAIDYFVTDALVDPPGTENLYVEKQVRLEALGRCYRPDENSPDPIPLPAERNGGITFGAFNRMTKTTDDMLGCWAEILSGVPRSRLQVLVDGPGGEQTSQSIRDRYARFGLTADQVQFVGRRPRRQYLETLAACDICLDTFTYNGCTTTCDALWMGTPVVTLRGTTHVSRVSHSFLAQVGLADLSVDSPTAYVRTAVELANDRQRLRVMRIGLRERMRVSPLMDGVGYAKRLETALRSMWEAWCHHHGG